MTILLSVLAIVIIFFIYNSIRQKNEKERQRNAQEAAAKEAEVLKQRLLLKYPEDIVLRLINKDYWVGMTNEQLLDANGKPYNIKTEVLKSKTKDTYYYSRRKSREYFVLENDIVVKIVN